MGYSIKRKKLIANAIKARAARKVSQELETRFLELSELIELNKHL